VAGVDKNWLASYVPLIVDGTVLGINAVVQDVSARKQSEEAVRRSEERYRSLFTSISEGLVLKEAVLDGAGNIVDFRFLEVNPAFTTQSGLTDVVGKTMLQVMPDIEPR
jgi:PAS domain-containing protein